MPFAFLMTDYLNRLEKGDPNVVRFHTKLKNWMLSCFGHFFGRIK